MKSNIFKLLSFYVSGIIFAELIEQHWVIGFTLWFFSFAFLLILVNLPDKSYHHRKWIGINILLCFFLTGNLSIQLNQPSFSENNFSEIYLENDEFVGEIIELQENGKEYNKAIIEIKEIRRNVDNLNTQGQLLCYIKSTDNQLNEGDIIQFKSNISPIKNKNNPWEFNAERYWRIKGIHYISFLNESLIEVIGHKTTFSNSWSKARNHLIQVVKKNISAENQGLAIGISLGDKSALSQEAKSQFTNAGIMHVLAVSGMHVGILLAFLQFIFKRIKPLRNRSLYLYFALATLWAFAFITGLSASVSRAVLTFSILAIGQLLGHRFFSLETIFGSALLLLIINPFWLFDIGFQLSYFAVISIALFYLPIMRLFHSRYKFVNWIWQGLAVGFAAQIGTIPISLYYFHQFPNYFILSNIGMLFLASAAFISVIILFVVHFVPYLVDIVAYITEIIFSVFNTFVVFINQLPAVISTGFTPPLFIVITIYLGIIILLYSWNNKKLITLRIASNGIFVLLLFIVIGRETNKLKQELIIFNHYEKNIAVKDAQVLHFIYDEQQPISEKTIHFLTQSYSVAMGTQTSIINLPKNAQLKLSNGTTIVNNEQGIFVDYFDHKIHLANKNFHKEEVVDHLIIKGDWNKYIENENIDVANGAFVLRPKSR